MTLYAYEYPGACKKFLTNSHVVMTRVNEKKKRNFVKIFFLLDLPCIKIISQIISWLIGEASNWC